MLKWSVANKQQQRPVGDNERRQSSGFCNIYTPQNSASAPKRRRHSTSRRRRSAELATVRRRRRTSLCLDLDKENQYTSTPIKESDYGQALDAFRDVSNLTPKENANKRRHRKRLSYQSPHSTKPKKKMCIKQHESLLMANFDDNASNFFKPFESVDSHIEGINNNPPTKCGCTLGQGKKSNYAPTLPTYSVDYSPTTEPVLMCQPKIDHVNDFLQRISLMTSPEDLRLRQLPGYRPSKSIALKSAEETDNSSFINELSIDKIVDAILDSSNSFEKDDNQSNETKEENLLNEKQLTKNNNNSGDSGFRSNSTSTLASCGGIPELKSLQEEETLKECKTIINVDDTYNERCVDSADESRKRKSSPENATLKRQKCIRRRKTLVEEITDINARSDLNDNSFDSTCGDPEGTYIISPPVSSNDDSSNSSLSFEGFFRKASIELGVQYENDEILLSIFRCTNLRRANGLPVNAYIKVALSERTEKGRRKHRGTLQRTAVQGESSDPAFLHTFRVPLSAEDLQKIIYVEVWHRDRNTRRSEFLGCTSFEIKDATKKKISGTYKLLPNHVDKCLSSTPIKSNKKEEESKMCDTSIDELIAQEGHDPKNNNRTSNRALLSQHQKDADENLFLRYLELDPLEGPEAAPAAAQRRATGNKYNGRTPFTTTRVLRRVPKSGFGFSVVWTHPPRIERVEKGLPADKSGMLPGDYLIFVDKHNVVMMPEIDTLNLIRSLGNVLTLEIFRRDASSSSSSIVPQQQQQQQPLTTQQQKPLSNNNGSVPCTKKLSYTFETESTTTVGTTGLPPPAPPSTATPRRTSTACSTNTASIEYNRKKLHLPQVTFSSERATSSVDEARRKAMYQIIGKEQNFVTAMQFGAARYCSALAERKDLLGSQDHRVLFQNCEELLRISEDVLDHLVHVDGDYHISALLKTYQMKLSEITSSYKRYCSGIKRADCVLARAMKSQEFAAFLSVPSVPRRRPDLTIFIHKPLEHYRELLKLFNIILTNTKGNMDEYQLVNQIVHDLQTNYREITSEAGLMEPIGEGRPLLSVQDLENRLVFTKCKPFVLSKPGRQWIFGGDLSRVEGRNVRQYWALLFSDILLFAKVSRDRVLFILEEPLPLSHISDLFFNIRKKENEFRIIVEPGGAKGFNRNASSPTVHCGPDLSRTPKKSSNKRCIVLRTPTVELKAVWQNLLQRQIYHINAHQGPDGSAYSSPAESPEVPYTSSVVTLLQSAESLSLRRNQNSSPRRPGSSCSQPPPASNKKQIDELIEHKCKQLEKSSSSAKSNAIHLEQWMKGQLGGPVTGPAYYNCRGDSEEEEHLEIWSDEMIRKRTEEIRLTNPHLDLINSNKSQHVQEDLLAFSDHEDESPSKSTNTTESQVTVRSSPLVPETVKVCKMCHKTCLPTKKRSNNNNNTLANGCAHRKVENFNEDDDWRPLMLMGLSAINPAARLVKMDPFTLQGKIPEISVLPPTPEMQRYANNRNVNVNCNCKPQVSELILSEEPFDNSPDDSPINEEQPYHSLHSSSLTLRRFGTVSSLERCASEEEAFDAKEGSSSDEGEIILESQNQSSLSWTARAGSFVAQKMAFFEKLGEEYRTSGNFFDRYLKSEISINGDEIQEEETSATSATSAEEVWGTPTSGGELDDPLSSPNYEGHQSPNGGGSVSSNDDTELMMDELLMTPPVTSANIRGLLPRRTLEPLMEEEFSDSYSSTSSSSSLVPNSDTPSLEQGSGTGDAADECSVAVDVVSRDGSASGRHPKMMPRSDSYRKIIDAEDDHLGFFTRFRQRPSMKFVNFERIPPSRGVKFLEFFNVRRERKIYETYPRGKHLIKTFSREDDMSDDVPTSYKEKPEILERIKQERQLDRRFWKQLSKRRSSPNNKSPVQLSA